MRVGITENDPWTIVEDEPRGVEVELLERFADDLDATIEWTEGSEQELFKALEERKLDVVIGGLESSNPFSMQATFTYAYYQEHVMAVPHGENGWLVTLEKFLLEDPELIRELLAEETP